MRPRNELGWRVPRNGTKSNLIYQFLYDGLNTGQIHALIGGSYKSVRVLIYKIKNPKAANAHAQKYHHHHSSAAHSKQG